MSVPSGVPETVGLSRGAVPPWVRALWSCTLLLELGLGLGRCWAQQNTLTVTDAAGAVLPGALVRLEVEGRDAPVAMTSDARGVVPLPAYPLGVSTLTVSADGFRTAVIRSSGGMVHSVSLEAGFYSGVAIEPQPIPLQPVDWLTVLLPVDTPQLPPARRH